MEAAATVVAVVLLVAVVAVVLLVAVVGRHLRARVDAHEEGLCQAAARLVGRHRQRRRRAEQRQLVDEFHTEDDEDISQKEVEAARPRHRRLERAVEEVDQRQREREQVGVDAVVDHHRQPHECERVPVNGGAG